MVDAEVRELVGTVRLYRAILVVVVLAVVGAASWSSRPQPKPYSQFGSAGATWTVDLAERTREKDRTLPADVSEVYLSLDEASVYMHFMGPRTTTPLHLHTVEHEAVVIAGGSAEIAHRWGQDGVEVTTSGTRALHTLIASPPYTAHEFHNPAKDAVLANLVFTIPHFAGNLFVRPGDDRILRGTAPTDARPSDDIGTLAPGEPFHLVTLPTHEGRLHELLVATSWTAPSNVGRPLVVYVAAGRGSAAGQPLRERVLLHLEETSPTEVRAEAGSPLALVVFDPRGALGSAK